MPMYNLLEYSKNYKKVVESLYNYYTDELNDDADNDNFANNNVVSSNTFNYKNALIGNTYNVDSTIPNPDPATFAANPRIRNPNYDTNRSGRKEVEIVIPLKYLGNFWRALNMPLISCEVSLELKWDKKCVITSQQIGVNLDGANTAAPTNAILSINDCKLYVPVVTLSKDNEIIN